MSRRSSKAATPTETKAEGPAETDDAPSHDASLDMSLGASLEESLRERIRREGAITFREWMRAALYDERRGYYRRRGAERWGRAGDYRTTPERSALFAATFARRFAAVYEELGRPHAFHLIEAGGGAGHFADGILRTLRRDAPQVFDALRYIFDETSDDSRDRAAQLLTPYAERVEFLRLRDIAHTLDAAVVFSNELLDESARWSRAATSSRLITATRPRTSSARRTGARALCAHCAATSSSKTFYKIRAVRI